MKIFLLLLIFGAVMCGFDSMNEHLKHIRRQNHKIIELLKK